MANPGDIVFQFLDACPNGQPRIIDAAADAADESDVIHTAPVGTTEVDMVYLWLCNSHVTETILACVVIFGDGGNAHISKIDLPPKSGAWLVIDGAPLTDEQNIGVYCPDASNPEWITAFGKVGRFTVTA